MSNIMRTQKELSGWPFDFPFPPADYERHLEVGVKVFVGGLPQSVGQMHLQMFFAKFGRVQAEDIEVTHNARWCSGYGYVVFRDAHDARDACSQAAPLVGGSPVLVMPCEYFDLFEDTGCQLSLPRDMFRKVWLGQFKCTRDDRPCMTSIRHYFEQFGTIEKFESETLEKGYMFVTFVEEKDANEAVLTPSPLISGVRGKVHFAVKDKHIRYSFESVFKRRFGGIRRHNAFDSEMQEVLEREGIKHVELLGIPAEQRRIDVSLRLALREVLITTHAGSMFVRPLSSVLPDYETVEELVADKHSTDAALEKLVRREILGIRGDLSAPFAPARGLAKKPIAGPDVGLHTLAAERQRALRPAVHRGDAPLPISERGANAAYSHVDLGPHRVDRLCPHENARDSRLLRGASDGMGYHREDAFRQPKHADASFNRRLPGSDGTYGVLPARDTHARDVFAPLEVDTYEPRESSTHPLPSKSGYSAASSKVDAFTAPSEAGSSNWSMAAQDSISGSMSAYKSPFLHTSLPRQLLSCQIDVRDASREQVADAQSPPGPGERGSQAPTHPSVDNEMKVGNDMGRHAHSRRSRDFATLPSAQGAAHARVTDPLQVAAVNIYRHQHQMQSAQAKVTSLRPSRDPSHAPRQSYAPTKNISLASSDSGRQVDCSVGGSPPLAKLGLTRSGLSSSELTRSGVTRPDEDGGPALIERGHLQARQGGDLLYLDDEDGWVLCHGDERLFSDENIMPISQGVDRAPSGRALGPLRGAVEQAPNVGNHGALREGVGQPSGGRGHVLAPWVSHRPVSGRNRGRIVHEAGQPLSDGDHGLVSQRAWPPLICRDHGSVPQGVDQGPSDGAAARVPVPHLQGVNHPLSGGARVRALAPQLTGINQRFSGGTGAHAPSSHLQGIDDPLSGGAEACAPAPRLQGINRPLSDGARVRAPVPQLQGIDHLLNGAEACAPAPQLKGIDQPLVSSRDCGGHLRQGVVQRRDAGANAARLPPLQAGGQPRSGRGRVPVHQADKRSRHSAISIYEQLRIGCRTGSDVGEIDGVLPNGANVNRVAGDIGGANRAVGGTGANRAAVGDTGANVQSFARDDFNGSFTELLHRAAMTERKEAEPAHEQSAVGSINGSARFDAQVRPRAPSHAHARTQPAPEGCVRCPMCAAQVPAWILEHHACFRAPGAAPPPQEVSSDPESPGT